VEVVILCRAMVEVGHIGYVVVMVANCGGCDLVDDVVEEYGNLAGWWRWIDIVMLPLFRLWAQPLLFLAEDADGC
jgi:hypothetical protein